MVAGTQTERGFLKPLRTDQLKVRDVPEPLAARPLNKLLTHTGDRKTSLKIGLLWSTVLGI